MRKDLNGRPYAPIKTGIDDLQKLKEVQRSLVRSEGTDRLRQRARIRREYGTKPLSRSVTAVQSSSSLSSNAPYRVSGYDPDSDRWQVSSLSNPSENFLAFSIKAGGIGTGDAVRGYAPTAIEPRSQGRRFSPVDDVIKPKEKELIITLKIGYTGRL